MTTSGSDPSMADLLGVAMEQIPDLSLTLIQALDDNGHAVEEADAEGVREAWAEAEPETRAALLLTFAWGSRQYAVYPGQLCDGFDDPSYSVAEELHTWAREFTGTSQDFHGTRFPAMPLPGPAGAFASDIGFERDEDELHVGLRAALLLLAPVRQAATAGGA